MTDKTSPVQILGSRVPQVPRQLPVPGPIQTHAIFYSQLFEFPPSEQGVSGDFYVSKSTILYKTQADHRVVAHFNHQVPHPSINTLHLSYDDFGPCWVHLPWQPRPFGQEWQPHRIAAQFHHAIAYHKKRQFRGPGSGADHPIEIYLD